MFDNWKPSIRWIVFVPIFFIAYFIANLFGRYAFWLSLGWIGLGDKTVIGFLIYNFYQSFGSFCIAILISTYCAPRGRIIVGSVYLGIVLLLIGFDTFSLITYGPPSGLKLWQAIYDYSLNVFAGIFALLSIVGTENERKKSFMELVAKRLDEMEEAKKNTNLEHERIIREKLGL